jgi:hypothetical protein
MNTIFGLTTSRAVGTLAVALVGFEYGVLSSDIFNAIILLILVINARPLTISYDPKFWNFTYKIPKSIKAHNLLMIYPHQYE